MTEMERELCTDHITTITQQHPPHHSPPPFTALTSPTAGSVRKAAQLEITLQTTECMNVLINPSPMNNGQMIIITAIVSL